MAKGNRSWNTRKRSRFETGKLGRNGFKESLGRFANRNENHYDSERRAERRFGLVDVRAGRKGLFTGEIEHALVAKAIDLAVHFGFVKLIAHFPLAVMTSIARYTSMPR